jgi:hypothetical protein
MDSNFAKLKMSVKIAAAASCTELQAVIGAWEKAIDSPFAGMDWETCLRNALDANREDLATVYDAAFQRWDVLEDEERSIARRRRARSGRIG